MRFVPTKTPDQQGCLMLHRTRHLFIRQQTAVINAIREFFNKTGKGSTSYFTLRVRGRASLQSGLPPR
jgi:transposase